MQNIIVHLDMNSYFASVEQQDHPQWRGLPVGVCEHLGGIIIAASVEAKKWGIKTGTPVWEAKKLYPKIILTHTRAEAYRFYTRRFLKVVGDYTDHVEKYSIDECFLDLTKACNVKKVLSDQCTVDSDPFEEAVSIALEIKKRFKTEVGDWLRCSVGIAENKTLAKIASDLKKPDGLVVVIPSAAEESLKLDNSSVVKGSFRSPSDALRLSRGDNNNILRIYKTDLYNRLQLTDIPGIGHRQEKNLNRLGIKTLRELRDYPESWLVSRFGAVTGHHLHSLGQLETSWKSGVRNEDEIKSVGHMYTLPQEFRKQEFFMPVLYKLCEMVGRRLRRKNLMGNIISCYCRDKNYEGFGDSKKLGYFVQDGREIFLESSRLISKPLRASVGREIKLVGVTVAGVRPYVKQLSLFGDVEQQRRLVGALDVINNKYGEFTLMRAEMFKAGSVFRDSVGFGRMKEL